MSASQQGPGQDEGAFTCVGCGVQSPATTAVDETSSTITRVHGWRLRRNPTENTVEARCPACYARFRTTSTTSLVAVTSVPPPASTRTPTSNAPSLLAPPPASSTSRRPDMGGDAVVSFAGGVERHRVPLAARCRSTWLKASVASLREHGHYDRYMALLPARDHDVIASSIDGMWLPIDLAVRHYETCDQLGLGTFEMVRLGYDVTSMLRASMVHTIVRLARGAGVTPWTLLGRADVLWSRGWDAGDVAVHKLGPHEARIEIAGWPCAKTTYCRVASRGMIAAFIELFAQKAVVRELPAICSATTVGYVASW